jgi:hypothetical protein
MEEDTIFQNFTKEKRVGLGTTLLVLVERTLGMEKVFVKAHCVLSTISH